MMEGQEVREKVLAETGLLAGAKFSIVRDEHGDYFTEYSEGERVSRVYQRSLDAALALFAEAVLDEESASLRTGVYDPLQKGERDEVRSRGNGQAPTEPPHRRGR